MKTCQDCIHYFTRDIGYSNYTVEGTDVYCELKLHGDNEGFDHWYGENKHLQRAETCPSYEEGTGVHLDVDEEDWFEFTNVQRIRWIARFGKEYSPRV